MMKKIIFLSVLSLMIQEAFAGQPPVTISAPSPAVVSSYSAGTSTVIQYTVTNNVPGRHFPISVSGISGPVSRTTVANDCGNALPNGPSTCQLGIAISPQSSNVNSLFNQTLYLNYQGRSSLSTPIAFSVTPTPITLIAAGQSFVGSSPPLLAVSTNSGSSFSFPTVTGQTTNGHYAGAGCTGSASSGICVAAGQDGTGSTPPFLSVSTNGGQTWAVKPVSGAPTNSGIYNAAACTGAGSSAICVVGGQNNSTNAPLIASSTDGGNTWSVKTISGAPAAGLISAVSCSGTGSTAVCIGAGTNTTGSLPLVVVSTDGGNTWSVKSVTGFTTAGQLKGASCVGSGSSAICMVTGTTTSLTLPLIAVSTDGGNTWNSKSITGAPATAVLQSGSCTGTGSSAICMASGNSTVSSSPPFVAQSTDGGNTWSAVTLVGAPTSGTLRSASCTGSGATTVCVAAGTDNTNSTWMIYSSSGGATTWNRRTVLGSPTTGQFRSVTCSGSGSTAICIAAGNATTSQPGLAVSTDGALTWNLLSPSGAPTSATLFATGATS